MKNRPSLEYVKERYKDAKRVRCLMDGEISKEFDKNQIIGITITGNDFYENKEEDQYKIYDCRTGEWAEIIEYKSQEPETKGKDPIVNKVIEQFLSRSNEGIEKYGTTLSDNNKDDFLQHLKEELMDAILYIEKVQEQIKEVKKFFN